MKELAVSSSGAASCLVTWPSTNKGIYSKDFMAFIRGYKIK